MRRAPAATLLWAIMGCGSHPIEAVSADPLFAARIASWSFDEGTGMVVHDSLDRHLDGTLVGGEWVTDGHLQGALRLPRGSWMRVEGFVQPNADFSVSVWVRLALADVGREGATTLLTTESWASGGPAPVIADEILLPSGGWDIHSSSTLPGAFDFAMSAVVDPDFDGTKTVRCCALELERWYHLVGVFDATSRTMSLYESGLLQDRRAVAGPWLAGDSTLYVGRSYIDGKARGADRMWSGTIDDLTIYDRALNEAQVQRLEHSLASLATRPL